MDNKRENAMNYWSELSVEFASQKNYLDSLFKVYPMSPNIKREIDGDKWDKIKNAFNSKNNELLIEELLDMDLFPIKDSYVAYLKKDRSSITRNPETVSRLAGHLYTMGLDEIFKKCTEPKETNRQIGPLFRRWLDNGTLGLQVCKSQQEFLNYNGNAVFNSTDADMKKFANKYLGYTHEKGLDFIAKYNGKYIIGEAKFLTDFGGHQDAQFADAISTITSEFLPNILGAEVIPIAICDGVIYISGNSKLFRHLKTHNDHIILSALLLNDFIHSL